MSAIKYKSSGANLTGEEKRKLATVLVELEARGINVSEKIQGSRTKTWPIDSNGFFSKLDGTFYNGTDNQRGFIESNAQFAFFIGGRGSGKTGAGAQKALRKIMKGESGAVLNPDFENFKTSTWPEFREWIPWSMVVPKHKYRISPDWEPLQPFTMVFINGVKVICKGVKDPDSGRGPNINWLWYDEFGRDGTGLSWKVSIAGVRIGKDPQRWATGTPNGIDHWSYDFAIKQDIPEEVLKAFADIEDGRELIEVFFGSIEDNKENLDPSFYAAMHAAYADDPYLKRQELDGQFVQKGATLGDRTWFDDKVLDKVPDGMTKRVRYWDLAASEKKMVKKRRLDPDDTVGTLMAWNGSRDFYIEDQVSITKEWKDIKDTILTTAILDGPMVEIRVEQEPGSGGKNQVAEIELFLKEKIENLLGFLPSYVIKPHVPEGDKIMRANVWFAEAKSGRIWIIKGDWNDKFLNQVDAFPGGRKDDCVDSASGARLTLAPIITWSDIEFLSI